MKTILSTLWLMAGLLLSGCATSTDQTARLPEGTETCHVCRYRNDLACVCVRVKDTTPRAEYQGATYYFCSEDCRAAFVKTPAKFLPK